MAVIVNENVGRSLQHPGAILHQALRVIDHRMIHPIGTAPASIQILVRQTVSIAADNESMLYRFKNEKDIDFCIKRNRTPVLTEHFAECCEHCDR